MATFTKLRNGSWGIRIDGKPEPGAQITVKKKSGETEAKVIDRVIWTGPDRKTGQPVSICSVKEATKASVWSSDQDYCYHACPVTERQCNPKNGPCHDCL